MRNRIVCSLLVMVGLVSVSPASAQTFHVENFEPMPLLGNNILNVAGSRTLEHLQLDTGLLFHLSHAPLVLADDGASIALIERRMQGEIWLGAGFFEFFDVGVLLPVVFYQRGTLPSDDEESTVATLGDVRLVPKLRLLDARRAFGFGAALAATLYIPSGDTESFQSDGAFRIEPRLVLDWSHPWGFLLSVNAAFQVRPERELFGYTSRSVLRYGAGLVAPTGISWLRVTGNFFGDLQLDDGGPQFGGGAAEPQEVLGGLQFLFPDDIKLMVGGGIGLSEGVASPDYRVYVAFGVSASPFERSPRKVAQATPSDRDGDGVPDDRDQCPDEPGPWENFGCPWPDSDGDGIPDHLDRCPHEPGPASNDGCPIPTIEPLIPPAPPREPPRQDPVRVTQDRIIVTEKIFFETNSAQIQQQSFEILDRIAQVLAEHPQIRRIRIEGHTDSRGRASHNMTLSQRRADAVRTYLVGRGVDPSRLEARGYGEDHPIADNETAAGREMNRRVEFTITDRR